MKLKITKVYRRFWWPHIYARERGLLWVKVVVGYRYYLNGKEVNFP